VPVAIRAVLDTSVCISALISEQRHCSRAFTAGFRDKIFVPILSPFILPNPGCYASPSSCATMAPALIPRKPIAAKGPRSFLSCPARRCPGERRSWPHA